MRMQKPRIAALGLATLEFVGVVPQDSRGGEVIELRESILAGGGLAATAAVAARKLGCKTRLASRIGDDPLGRAILSELLAEGVDCTSIAVTPGARSPFGFVALAEPPGKPTFFLSRGNAGSLHGDQFDGEGFLHKVDLLLIDGHFGEIQAIIARQARREGVLVVLCAGALQESLTQLVELSNVVVVSRDVALAPPETEAEARAALAPFQALGPRRVVLPLGERGAIGLDDDRLVRIAPPPAAHAQASGVDGVYEGALCAGLARGLPFESAMRLAAATQALTAGRLAGRAGIPSWQQVASAITPPRAPDA